MLKELFQKLSGESKSANVAKNRLKVIIAQDRAHLSSEVLELLKQDIIKVVEKYLEIERQGLECSLAKEERRSIGLEISVPVKKIKYGG
jgi:cell division topological specificity factor